MASATQRFFSYAIGEQNQEKLNKIFCVNLVIYGTIIIVVLVLLETLGIWFVNEQLNVPFERLSAIRWVYHFSVLTFVVTIFMAPFLAIIIAHEDMQLYAYVSIIEAIMKLGIVFILKYAHWDKLELYGVLIFAVAAITSIIYICLCLWKYSECQFRKFYWDKELLHEITGFTGWTLFGQVTTVVRTQAITILLNQVFSPIIIASRAVATNIASQISIFSSNFNVGLYPPIIKSYATDDKNGMFDLIYNGSKITFFLMWIFALPLFLEMDIIMQVWLKNPPPLAVLFTRLALIEVLINSISLPIATAARAPGKMKVYELSLGSIQIAIFFIAWLVLSIGGDAYSVYIVAISANIIMFIVRLLIVRGLIGISLKLFYVKVILPVSLVVLFSVIPSFALHFYLPRGIIYSIVSGFVSLLISCISMYYFGLDKEMRNKVVRVIVNRIGKKIEV